jgi:hypothetical protein
MTELSWGPFDMILIPFIRVPFSRPDYFPKAPTLSSISLGIRILRYEFKEDKNIQSITET